MTMVAVAIGASAVVGLYTADRQRSAAKKAADDAEEQAILDRERAAAAETFAVDEEGGIGSLGKIDLALDDELETDKKVRNKLRV